MDYETTELGLDIKRKISEKIKEEFELSPLPVVALFHSDEEVTICLLHWTPGGRFVEPQFKLLSKAFMFRDKEVDNTLVPVEAIELDGRPYFKGTEGKLYQPIVV